MSLICTERSSFSAMRPRRLPLLLHLGDFFAHLFLRWRRASRRKDFPPLPVNGFKDGNVQIIAPVLEHLFDRIKIGSDKRRSSMENLVKKLRIYKDTFLSQIQLKRQTFLSIRSIYLFEIQCLRMKPLKPGTRLGTFLGRVFEHPH